MFTDALYYPYILIPDNLWLRQAILYWDKIKPIVPWEVERQIDPNHVSRQLETAGVLEFVHPEAILEWGDGTELSESFLNVVTSEEFLSKIGSPERRKYETRIHRHKFADGLLEGLAGLNLFKEIDGGWLLFETNSGIIYLGFLASRLAERLYLEPITDNKIYQDGFLWSQLVPSAQPEVAVSSLVLEKLLPCPRGEISIKNIIRFKEKHEGELLAFRRLIRHTVESLQSADETQFGRILYSARDNIKEQCLILDSRLKANRIETVLNVLEVPFRLSERDVEIAATATVSIPVTLALLGVRALLGIAREVYHGHLRARSMLERNPYAYVFNIKRKLGGRL